MKLSNFDYHGKTGDSVTNYRFSASVDVTTGFLLWKKTITRHIQKTGTYWFFEDTGRYTPGIQAETLTRAYEAIHKCTLREIKLP